MGRPNYQQNKRRKEIAKRKKKEEKLRKKQQKKEELNGEITDSESGTVQEPGDDGSETA